MGATKQVKGIAPRMTAIVVHRKESSKIPNQHKVFSSLRD